MVDSENRDSFNRLYLENNSRLPSAAFGAKSASSVTLGAPTLFHGPGIEGFDLTRYSQDGVSFLGRNDDLFMENEFALDAPLAVNDEFAFDLGDNLLKPPDDNVFTDMIKEDRIPGTKKRKRSDVNVRH